MRRFLSATLLATVAVLGLTGCAAYVEPAPVVYRPYYYRPYYYGDGYCYSSSVVVIGGGGYYGGYHGGYHRWR